MLSSCVIVLPFHFFIFFFFHFCFSCPVFHLHRYWDRHAHCQAANIMNSDAVRPNASLAAQVASSPPPPPSLSLFLPFPPPSHLCLNLLFRAPLEDVEMFSLEFMCCHLILIDFSCSLSLPE
ncbi:hypothetical protein GGS21DRAFT_398032 [Xylaria nigripes]|nr:hypothetical protein GGS21DRAFT_398032 [Xylaria nigripes]